MRAARLAAGPGPFTAPRHENNLSFLPQVPHPVTLRGQVQEMGAVRLIICGLILAECEQ